MKSDVILVILFILLLLGGMVITLIYGVAG